MGQHFPYIFPMNSRRVGASGRVQVSQVGKETNLGFATAIFTLW